MSSTSKTLISQWPCLCGFGLFEKYRCEPNSMFRFDEWEEVTINCKYCNEKYKVCKDPNGFFLITKESIKNSELLLSEADNLTKELLRSSDVLIMIEEIKKMVLAEKYATNKYNIFSKTGFYRFKIDRFRREYKDSDIDEFIERNLSYSSIKPMQEFIGRESETVNSKLDRISKLEEKSEAAKEIIKLNI